MSLDETVNENNAEIAIEVASEDLGEPKAKQIKIELSTTESNLQNPPNVMEIKVENSIDLTVEVLSDGGTEETEAKGGELESNQDIKAENVTNNSLTEPTEECLQENSPCISITFHDAISSLDYKSKFLEFLRSFSEFQVQNENDFIMNIYKDEGVGNVKEDPDKTPLSKKRKKHSKVKKELFVVDSTPSDHIYRADLWYETKFIVVSEKTAESENDFVSASRNGCFNCGDPHALKDCLVPKDYARISMARQKFKFQYKTSRYHSDDQKYGHLEPGKISNELRRALGLQKNEAPHFIYQMRKMGYPPGWLEEAKFVNSNLDLFDIDGKNVQSAHIKKHGLDESKIVDYPGFNVPFNKGIKDDYRTYRVPPYSENFNKKIMVDFFEKQFAQNISKDVQEKKQEHLLNPTIERSSPSLVDLEQQKLQLLEELNDEPKDDKKDSDYDSDKGFLAVKTSCLGTPLLKSSSPFSSLPNPDNFSKDVSPVINFENLPNSTGKYDQLTDVLQKVRDTLKKGNSS